MHYTAKNIITVIRQKNNAPNLPVWLISDNVMVYLVSENVIFLKAY